MKGRSLQMDEKDFELDEELKIKPDDSAQINSDEDIKADSTDIKAGNEPEEIKNTAGEVNLNELELTNNAKPMIGDISFGNLFDDHDNEERPEVEVDKVGKEPDSDVIIPESQKIRTEISGDADSRPDKEERNEIDKSSKNTAEPQSPSKNKPSQQYTDDVFDIDDEEEEFRIVNNEPKSKNRKKKKSKPAKVNNSIFGGLIIISVILTASILLAYGGIKMGMEYLGIGKNSNNITFNIPEGSTSDDVIRLLQENDIITQPKLFSIIMRMKDKTFYPGDITLKPSMSYSAIIDALSVNRESRDTVSITFPEGIRLSEAAKLLEDNKVCAKKDFIFEFNKNQGFYFENLLEDSDLTFYKMEGFFFPDTYDFYLEDDAYNVARIIKERFAEKFTASMESTMKQNGFSLNELITLASMVQREAGTKKDMPIVASVFINRLDNPSVFPSLESDATSNYISQIIKKEAGTNLSIKHFTDSYDTYHCKGLPAGAICNPGIDAIKAVLNPEETKYYYFCNNLDTGKAYYAETLKQHEKNLVKAGLVSAE